MSPREQLEIQEQLTHNVSWKEFKAFIEDRKKALLAQATQSVELKDVLIREGSLGALSDLSTLLDDFLSHIDRNTTKE